jgi:hypothetical protein
MPDVLDLAGLILVLGIAAIAAIAGIGFGIVLIAPRIERLLDAEDEKEQGDDA